MSLTNRLGMVYRGILHIVNNVSVTEKGQKTNFAILQTAHRLEKGLCIQNPRKGWGYDKAQVLIHLIEKEQAEKNPDRKAIEIGCAVLAAYIGSKEIQKDDKDKLEKVKEKAASLKIEANPQFGGAVTVYKQDMLQDDNVEHLFLSRHSVRDFSDEPVDMKKIEKAVTLALRAPSACNRQASQVYVISGEDRIKAGGGNEYNADKYLIITGNMRAFVLSELNDWIVSTSVFCGYLSLALHAEGIGSCIFRKEIIKKSKYNDNVREMCHIPDDEQIILEMAIGNYQNEFNVPVSCRREAKEIIHYL